MSSRPVYWMCAQVVPSGECPRGYKPHAVVSSRLAPLCGSFLPVLNPVVIPGLRAGTCCAVLHGSLYVQCESKKVAPPKTFCNIFPCGEPV